MGYVDAYYLFEKHPRVTAVCDVVLTNCYPFWEGVPREHALPYMQRVAVTHLNRHQRRFSRINPDYGQIAVIVIGDEVGVGHITVEERDNDLFGFAHDM